MRIQQIRDDNAAGTRLECSRYAMRMQQVCDENAAGMR